jgi:hypothetical protein
MKDKKFDSLKLLFNFFKETELLGDLKNAWLSFIKAEGTTILSQIKDKKFSQLLAIKDILQLKDLTDKVVN